MTAFSRGQRVIGAATHYVENQPPWRVDVDEFASNAPLVEAVTVFVTNDRMLHLWARVLDFQFVRRKHFIERDIDIARRFVARRQSARMAKMNGK